MAERTNLLVVLEDAFIKYTGQFGILGVQHFTVFISLLVTESNLSLVLKHVAQVFFVEVFRILLQLIFKIIIFIIPASLNEV